ncbi:MAG: Glycosyl transferase, group 1 [Parcubacteria bacterium C7867-008]|nr:MAG: Glycosyl transferase, group 1 [Parcubacteria bacterium C7867-008]
MTSPRTISSKKIAFLISSFRAGGGERVMITLANTFAARGYNVDLLVLKPVGQYAEHVDERVNVRSLDRRRMALSLFPLMRYMKEEKPETLLALDEFTHLLALAARYLTKSDTRIVLRIGNMLSELFTRYEGLKSKLLPTLIRAFYKYADGVIAVSKGVRDDIIELTHILPERVSVIYQPKPRSEILEKAQEPVDHPWFKDKTVPLALFVGRLREQKNLPVLIRSFAAVRANMPARLALVGNGREEARVRALIAELNMEDSIELIGYADNPYKYMSKADVFVFPTLWEGMPNALLEAMVVGLPVIASDCSGAGPREIIAPDTDHQIRMKNGVEYATYGVLTAVNDEEALTEAIQTLLSDPTKRAAYAAKSRERSEDFDADGIIDEYALALGI